MCRTTWLGLQARCLACCCYVAQPWVSVVCWEGLKSSPSPILQCGAGQRCCLSCRHMHVVRLGLGTLAAYEKSVLGVWVGCMGGFGWVKSMNLCQQMQVVAAGSQQAFWLALGTWSQRGDARAELQACAVGAPGQLLDGL